MGLEARELLEQLDEDVVREVFGPGGSPPLNRND